MFNKWWRFVLVATFCVSGAMEASAHFEFLSIRVISFQPTEKPDRYTLVFDAETTDYGKLMNLPRKTRRFTVHLRCDPAFCDLAGYREAVALLKERPERGFDVEIARMSSKGWQPIKGKRGEFESVGLMIPSPPPDWKGPPVLLFIHDNRF